jgi:hypothetical protein
MSLCIWVCLLAGCTSQVLPDGSVIAAGKMPVITRDHANVLHLVYGSGDSIMYSYSTDHGKTFSASSVVSGLPHLAASHTRGPQLTATTGGLVLTACNNSGDIFSFVKEGFGQWYPSGKVNDRDTVAKENLMALAADASLVFAVWLDLRDGHNKIFGAASSDGGKTWGKNKLVYASPDSTVCECCKPSVAVKGRNIYVMFRNRLGGNRDMYMAASADGGNSFGPPRKLGNGSWPLKGCPMDGGGISIGNGTVQTVWNREGKIYASMPGQPEQEIGAGKNCTIETVNGKKIYAWVENGDVVYLNSEGAKKVVGKGQLPLLKEVDDAHVICIWQQDGQILKSLMDL